MFSRRGLAIWFGVLAGTTMLMFLVMGLSSGKAQQIAANQLVDVSNLLSPFERDGLGQVSEGLGGAAWLDYNNDGLLDLFITNGAGHPNALFRNNGDGTFTDVAAQAGVANGLGNSAVAAVDIDNDGCVDLFLVGEGAVAGVSETPNNLYINNCDGTFTDITAQSGIDSFPSGAMAAFGDINNDGFVDLFITGPGNIRFAQPQANRLFLNNGNRTFTNISHSAGIDSNLGACAVGFSDFNDDGLADIFVANCNGFSGPFKVVTTPFELFRNNGNLTFTDVAPQVGLAKLGFWMSVSFGDYKRDGNIDVFSANVGAFPPRFRFPHALFRNNGDHTYTDAGSQAGVANWEFGWGTSFADFYNNGHEDLFAVGSLPIEHFGLIGPGVASPGRLFKNNGDGTFTNVQAFGLENQYTSGVAVGDFNNDGFPDVVVVKTKFDLDVRGHRLTGDGHPLLLKNVGNSNSWITVRLIGTESNRCAIGARVTVTAGGVSQVKEVYAGSGFHSTNSPWLTFGLGNVGRADIQVTWPSGLKEIFRNVSARQTVTLVEEDGEEDEGQGRD